MFNRHVATAAALDGFKRQAPSGPAKTASVSVSPQPAVPPSCPTIQSHNVLYWHQRDPNDPPLSGDWAERFHRAGPTGCLTKGWSGAIRFERENKAAIIHLDRRDTSVTVRNRDLLNQVQMQDENRDNSRDDEIITTVQLPRKVRWIHLVYHRYDSLCFAMSREAPPPRLPTARSIPYQAPQKQGPSEFDGFAPDRSSGRPRSLEFTPSLVKFVDPPHRPRSMPGEVSEELIGQHPAHKDTVAL